MRTIKRFFMGLAILLLGLAALIALSLHGEKDYLETCKHLALSCEPGPIQRASAELRTWLAKLMSQLPVPPTL